MCPFKEKWNVHIIQSNNQSIFRSIMFFKIFFLFLGYELDKLGMFSPIMFLQKFVK